MVTADDTATSAEITGINVTPLVDITLVLLIVFLVTAKVIVSQAIPLEVPKVNNTPGAVQSVLSISITEAGAISVDGKNVTTQDELARIARERKAQDPEVRAVLRAATDSRHGSIVAVIDTLRGVGVTRIAFAVQKDDHLGK